jgi:RNA polymerase sigma-70 factor (ECF subfamily)
MTDNTHLARAEPDSGLEVADESLAASACAGDEFAFEQLFHRHRRRISRLAGRFFIRPEKVEEVVQEVFAKMYFALGGYSPERGQSFSAWLSRITINQCYDQLRRAKRRPESSPAALTDIDAICFRARLHSVSASGDAESGLVSRDLASKLLARLSPDDRVVLTLLDAEEMSVAEIAGLMGWSCSKVKVRAHRARASLRRVLGEFI